MTPDRPAGPGRSRGRHPRETFAERRERRGAVDDPAVVLEAAARFLEVRSRSVAEVRRRLMTSGYRGDLVDGAIARMVELGMLDDDAFARAWVESRDRSRPRGERAIRVELTQKGVDRTIVDQVLDDRRTGSIGSAGSGPILDDDDRAPPTADHAAAERLIARHRRSLERVAEPRQRRGRAYALLARNGFDPDICRAVAAAAVGSIEADSHVEGDVPG